MCIVLQTPFSNDIFLWSWFILTWHHALHNLIYDLYDEKIKVLGHAYLVFILHVIKITKIIGMYICGDETLLGRYLPSQISYPWNLQH